MVKTLAVGTTLHEGRFRVERRLGSGGQGAVYQVYDQERRQTCALKLIDLEHEQDEERFRKEGQRTLAAPDHANLIDAYEFDLLTHDGRRYGYLLSVIAPTPTPPEPVPVPVPPDPEPVPSPSWRWPLAGWRTLMVWVIGCGAAAYMMMREPAAPKVKIEDGMAFVPAGWLTRGSMDGPSSGSMLSRGKVYVSDFWIDVYEVTTAEYAACVRAGNCTAPKTGGSCNWGVDGREKHPVNCVNWVQATSYCAWKEERLPREVEWEKAARGTDGRKYPWGDDEASCKYAVMYDGGNGCGRGDATWPVGSKPEGVSPYGVHDMAGNVWEWVSDIYASDHYQDDASERDPEGPKSGSDRVVRGGSWAYDGDSLRAVFRGRYAPSGAVSNLGFRCAMSTE